MNPQAIKVLAFVAAGALGTLAALELPAIDQFDSLLAAAAAFLVGWSGLRRPGDEVPK